MSKKYNIKCIQKKKKAILSFIIIFINKKKEIKTIFLILNMN